MSEPVRYNRTRDDLRVSSESHIKKVFSATGPRLTRQRYDRKALEACRYDVLRDASVALAKRRSVCRCLGVEHLTPSRGIARRHIGILRKTGKTYRPPVAIAGLS